MTDMLDSEEWRAGVLAGSPTFQLRALAKYFISSRDAEIPQWEILVRRAGWPLRPEAAYAA